MDHHHSFEFSHKYPDRVFHTQHWIGLHRRQARLGHLLDVYNSKLENNRNIRLILGLALVIFAVLTAAKPNAPYWGLFFLGSIPVFAYFIVKTGRIYRFTVKLQLLRDFYLQQLTKLKGAVHSAKNSEDLEETVRNADLNILGEHSVFSQMDETFSVEGSQILAHRLNQGLSSTAAIEASHEKILQLNKYFPVARRFLIEGRKAQEPILLKDLEEVFEHPIINKGYYPNLIGHLIFFPAYLITFYLIGVGKIQAPLALPIVAYAVFSLVSLKSVLAAFRQGEILERSLSGLIPVFSFAETKKHVFSSDLPTLKNRSFSQSLKSLKMWVSFLSIQSHALAYLIVNALCPWTFVFSGLTESWRKKNKTQFLQLLKEMSQTEVSASMAVFYHYQTQTLPTFTESFNLEAKEAYHPLIPRGHVVANSISLNGQPSMILLTGSNMSGKSTFMRTLAVNQTLAMAGAPVFARQMETTLAPVVSCMQIKDSLEMGYSYFYAEVKKVKEILETVASGHRTFFFIDEIFKGTNNRERLIGSKAVIESLSKYPHARGIVSTHDLELSQLADASKSVKNYHFRDDVSDKALVFSYQLQEGPCPTTNALKIMKAEGLPVG